MIQTPVNKFLESSVQTASPEQLLIMLCDGAIKFCKIAILAISEKDFVKAHNNLTKVQDIINEFIITLDQKAPISQDLMRLYEYFNRLLVQANMKKEVQPAEEVLGYLIELRDTWKHAQIIARSSRMSS